MTHSSPSDRPARSARPGPDVVRRLQLEFAGSIEGLLPVAELFDGVPDIVFFVKDRAGRYLAVNETLVARCQLSCKEEALGRTARDIFPGELGESFAAQDAEIVALGRGLRDRLELHFYPGGRRGWCLSHKEPVRDARGRAIGLCGISRDLQMPGERECDLSALSAALEHIRQNLDQPLRLPELARIAGLSVYQFDQRIRALFQLTAGQYLVKLRIDAACAALAAGDAPIAEIALDCGYSDQSSFSRQFKQAVGFSPLAFRRRTQGG